MVQFRMENKKDGAANNSKIQSYKLVEMESVYNVKDEIEPNKLTIMPHFARFLSTHTFSNVFGLVTVKDKKFLRKGQPLLKHLLNLKLIILYDKFNFLQDYPVDKIF